MKKPPECRGCPLYQDGDGFVPDEVIEGAKVFVLGQNPGAEEEKKGKPFVGRTGEAMMSRFFPVAGLRRGENVSIGNTIRCRYQGTNNLPSGKSLNEAISHCTAAHLRIPSSTKLIVAQGAVAMKALAKDKSLSVTDWRGFFIESDSAVTKPKV